MYPHAVLAVLVALCLGSCDGGSDTSPGSVKPSSVTDDQLLGFWIAAPEGEDWHTLEFWSDDTLGAVFAHGQVNEGHYPDLPMQSAPYQVDGGDLVTLMEEVIVDPYNPANWWLDVVERQTNISTFGDGVMTLDLNTSTVIATTDKSKLTLTHIGPDDPCPIGDVDGWRYASLAHMGSVGLYLDKSFINLVTDSAGRPYAFFAESGGEGSATIAATPRGCRWVSHGITAAANGGIIRMDGEDRIHALLRTSAAFLYLTHDTRNELSAWDTVQVAQNNSGGFNSSMGLTVDGDGVPWVMQKMWDWTDTPPTLARVLDGQLDPITMGPRYQSDGNRIVFDLDTDTDGQVHAFLGPFEDPSMPSGVLYEFDHLTFNGTEVVDTVRIPIPGVELDGGVVGMCSLRGLQIVDNGDLEASCVFSTNGVGGYTAHVVWGGMDWEVTWLGMRDSTPLRITPDGTRLISDGMTTLRRNGGSWTAAGSKWGAAASLTGVDVDPSGRLQVIHAGNGGWAQLVEEPTGTTAVTISFAGLGTGRVVSTDGAIDCTSECQVSIPWGTVVRLVAEADPGSVYLASANTGTVPTGEIVFAVTDPEEQTIYVQFTPE